MVKYSKGQLEAQISDAIVKFEIEHMGRGPEVTKTYIIDDIVFVRLKGVLTIAEKQLAKNDEGKLLIKRTRSLLLENSKDILKNIIEEITDVKVISLHTDISIITGERIIVFTLSKNLEDKF